MSAIVPVLEEWNRKNREGETTKHAAQMALFYYEELTKPRTSMGSRDDTKDKLIATDFEWLSRAQAELHGIVEQVIATEDTSRRGRIRLVRGRCSRLSPKAPRSQRIFHKTSIRLANLFWFDTEESGEIFT